MNLTRWDPFREMEELSGRLNRMFGMAPRPRLADENGATFTDWTPALDVEETDKEYLVKADLPEIKKDEIKIQVEDGMLCLEGERRQEKEEKNRKFHRVERSYGRFMRRLALPTDVDEQKVAAEFKDGVLQVHLPKAAAAKPRSTNVKIA